MYFLAVQNLSLHAYSATQCKRIGSGMAVIHWDVFENGFLIPASSLWCLIPCPKAT